MSVPDLPLSIDYETDYLEYHVYVNHCMASGSPCSEARAREIVSAWDGCEVDVRVAYRKVRKSVTFWSTPLPADSVFGGPS